MNKVQIYIKKGVYAVVNERTTITALCLDGELPDKWVDFRRDRSWRPVKFGKVPAWLKDQINEFNLS